MKLRASGLLLLILFLGACSNSVGSKIKKIKKQNIGKSRLALEKLDELYEVTENKKAKLEILKSISEIVRVELKDPNLLLQVYEKEAFFSPTPEDRNDVYLKMSQLSVQNLKDNILAQDFLFKVDEDLLTKEKRDQYYQLKILSFINSGQTEQAQIEIDDLLSRKDLTPTERFKISMLKTRILSSNKKEEEVETILLSLLKSYPNLSMKWRIRSQLAMLYEDQENLKKALVQLNKLKEEEGEDELLSIRIDQLKKRSKQQPGAKGRLRR